MPMCEKANAKPRPPTNIESGANKEIRGPDRRMAGNDPQPEAHDNPVKKGRGAPKPGLY